MSRSLQPNPVRWQTFPTDSSPGPQTSAIPIIVDPGDSWGAAFLAGTGLGKGATMHMILRRYAGAAD